VDALVGFLKNSTHQNETISQPRPVAEFQPKLPATGVSRSRIFGQGQRLFFPFQFISSLNCLIGSFFSRHATPFGGLLPVPAPGEGFSNLLLRFT
jgi:hypothetical protein